MSGQDTSHSLQQEHDQQEREILNVFAKAAVDYIKDAGANNDANSEELERQGVQMASREIMVPVEQFTKKRLRSDSYVASAHSRSKAYHKSLNSLDVNQRDKALGRLLLRSLAKTPIMCTGPIKPMDNKSKGSNFNKKMSRTEIESENEGLDINVINPDDETEANQINGSTGIIVDASGIRAVSPENIDHALQSIQDSQLELFEPTSVPVLNKEDRADITATVVTNHMGESLPNFRFSFYSKGLNESNTENSIKPIERKVRKSGFTTRSPVDMFVMMDPSKAKSNDSTRRVLDSQKPQQKTSRLLTNKINLVSDEGGRVKLQGYLFKHNMNPKEEEEKIFKRKRFDKDRSRVYETHSNTNMHKSKFSTFSMEVEDSKPQNVSWDPTKLNENINIFPALVGVADITGNNSNNVVAKRRRREKKEQIAIEVYMRHRARTDNSTDLSLIKTLKRPEKMKKKLPPGQFIMKVNSSNSKAPSNKVKHSQTALESTFLLPMATDPQDKV